MPNGKKKNLLDGMDYSQFLPKGGYQTEQPSSTDVAPVQKKTPLTGLDNIRGFYSSPMAMNNIQQAGSISPTVEKSAPQKVLNKIRGMNEGAQLFTEATVVPSILRSVDHGTKFAKDPSWSEAGNTLLNLAGAVPGAGLGIRSMGKILKPYAKSMAKTPIGSKIAGQFKPQRRGTGTAAGYEDEAEEVYYALDNYDDYNRMTDARRDQIRQQARRDNNFQPPSSNLDRISDDVLRRHGMTRNANGDIVSARSSTSNAAGMSRTASGSIVRNAPRREQITSGADFGLDRGAPVNRSRTAPTEAPTFAPGTPGLPPPRRIQPDEVRIVRNRRLDTSTPRARRGEATYNTEDVTPDNVNPFYEISKRNIVREMASNPKEAIKHIVGGRKNERKQLLTRMMDPRPSIQSIKKGFSNIKSEFNKEYTRGQLSPKSMFYGMQKKLDDIDQHGTSLFNTMGGGKGISEAKRKEIFGVFGPDGKFREGNIGPGGQFIEKNISSDSYRTTQLPGMISDVAKKEYDIIIPGSYQKLNDYGHKLKKFHRKYGVEEGNKKWVEFINEENASKGFSQKLGQKLPEAKAIPGEDRPYVPTVIFQRKGANVATKFERNKPAIKTAGQVGGAVTGIGGTGVILKSLMDNELEASREKMSNKRKEIGKKAKENKIVYSKYKK